MVSYHNKIQQISLYILNSIPKLMSFKGDSLWKDLELEFNKVDHTRREMLNAFAFRTDSNQLRKYKELFLE